MGSSNLILDRDFTLLFAPRVACKGFEKFIYSWLHDWKLLTGVGSHDSDQRVGDHILAPSQCQHDRSFLPFAALSRSN